MPKLHSFLALTVLGCILLTLPPSVSAQDVSDARKYYSRAIKAESIDDKIEHLQKAISLEPLYKEAIFLLGKSYYQKGAYTEAVAAFNQTVHLDSTYYYKTQFYLRNAHTFIAIDFSRTADYQLAMMHLQEALAIDRDYSLALTTLGSVYFNLGDWQTALQEFKQSLSIDPNQDSAWRQLGDLYFKLELYTKSVNAYSRALEINPDLPEMNKRLEIAKNRKNQPEFLLKEVQAILATGSFEEAYAFLQDAKKLHPENAEISATMEALKLKIDSLAASAASLDSSSLSVKGFETNKFGLHPEILPTVGQPKTLDASTVEESTTTSVQDSLKNKEMQHTEIPEVSRNEDLSDDLPEGIVSIAESKPEIVIEQSPIFLEKDSVVNVASDSMIRLAFNKVKGTDSSQTRADVPPKVPMKMVQPKLITFAEGIGIIGGIIALSLLFLKLRKNLRTTVIPANLRKVLQSETGFVKPLIGRIKLSTRTVSFFREKLTSETGLTFKTADTHTLLTDQAMENQGQRQPSKGDKTISLQETRTFVRKLGKVRQIGRYVIEKEIARGPMGHVFKAWDPRLDRTVVIKQVAFDFGQNSNEYKNLKIRLYREARAAARLNHPNIVVVYDIDEEDGFCYIVMEYLEGEDLSQYLEREILLDLSQAIPILSQIGAALKYAHNNGVIHRDIKPSNIIFSKDSRIKVADFGIAKLPQLRTLTQTGDIMGTPFYMSPEQIEGRSLDGRADIFSVGVLLYEMVTGIRPFDGDGIPTLVYKIVHQQAKPPSKINGNLPPEFDEFIEKALAKDPDNRFSTISHLLNALGKFAHQNNNDLS